MIINIICAAIIALIIGDLVRNGGYATAAALFSFDIIFVLYQIMDKVSNFTITVNA